MWCLADREPGPRFRERARCPPASEVLGTRSAQTLEAGTNAPRRGATASAVWCTFEMEISFVSPWPGFFFLWMFCFGASTLVEFSRLIRAHPQRFWAAPIQFTSSWQPGQAKSWRQRREVVEGGFDSFAVNPIQNPTAFRSALPWLDTKSEVVAPRGWAC